MKVRVGDGIDPEFTSIPPVFGLAGGGNFGGILFASLTYSKGKYICSFAEDKL
jgi:hypothetical protein